MYSQCLPYSFVMKKTTTPFPQRFLLSPGMLSYNASRMLAIVSGIILLVVASIIAYLSRWGDIPGYQMFFHFGVGTYLLVYGYFLLSPASSTAPRLEITDTMLFIKPSVFKKGNIYYWTDIKALELQDARIIIYYKNEKQTAATFDTRPKEDLKQIRISIREMAELQKVRINKKS
jgi:hypothetical protein